MPISWDAYRTALPSIAQAVGRTPLVRLNRVTAGGPGARARHAGEIIPHEGQALAWVAPEELERYQFPPADGHRR